LLDDDSKCYNLNSEAFKMIKIAITNQKGGVAKTTTAISGSTQERTRHDKNNEKRPHKTGRKHTIDNRLGL